ncbi:VP3 [Halogeometricum pleomorphic virus 1]|uniref:VP3 n=1 Tax=Halogeometricum pleomorphic virus 1 TaxID=1156722 RepID=H9ABQ4_9VIRU|nr:VP3 [Halogeometricum pleomorphic virus 1]AFD04024.1 VP3 [Halogeometricum pleomorphic virus 1]
MDIDLNAETVTMGLASIGAANYATAEFLQFDVMSEFLSGSPELGAIAFGAAGVVSLTEMFDVTEIFD